MTRGGCTTAVPPHSSLTGLFIDWDEAGPLEIAPMLQSETAVELRPYSHNLKRRADGGWAILSRLLVGVRTVRPLRSQDLGAAAAAIRELVDADAEAPLALAR